jgi:RimJ/RimL family protein N-acetyltransferase
MIVSLHQVEKRGARWILRCPELSESCALAGLGRRIDAETCHLDREPDEESLDADDFATKIATDRAEERRLFLVAETESRIVGFARCIGGELRRFRHTAEFGLCVEKACWGRGIGRSLVDASLSWADSVGIRKVSLRVIETNLPAIHLYESLGFVREGLLVRDRLHRDGVYYNTLLMSRWH